MNKSGVIFQECDLNAMPDPDTLVLCVNEAYTAHIGTLHYTDGEFICRGDRDDLGGIVKWAHIAPVELPDPLKTATEAATKHFASDFAPEEEAASFFAGWDAAIKFIEKQLA